MHKKLSPLAFLMMAAPAAAETAAVDLVGYRAVYEIAFDSAASASGIIGAEGRYVFDLDDACEGYTTNERFVVRLARAEEPILQDYRLSAYEAADGGSYRFTRSVDLNGLTGQKSSGMLTQDADEDTAFLDYESADDLSWNNSVVTPIAFIRELLETARTDEQRHAAMVFDGDVDAPVFYAVTRILPAKDGDGAEEEPAALAGLDRWRIDTVYYPPETGGEGEGAVPQFLFEGLLYENGIVTNMRLDYVDFALTATLSDLELRESGC